MLSIERYHRDPFLSDSESDAISPINTPPSTIIGDNMPPTNQNYPQVPYPNSTFIIRSIQSGDVLALSDGQIKMKRPDDPGRYWACVEYKGWLGFKNVVSGRYLGYDKDWELVCTARSQDLEESFCYRVGPFEEGKQGAYGPGCFLMMQYREWFSQVGINKDGKLARLKDYAEVRMLWEFIKV